MISNLHLVMHGVAIKKHCAAEEIARLIDMPAAEVADELSAAELSGRVVAADGKFMLSPAGQMILRGEYSRYYAELQDSGDFISAYDRFEIINTELKSLITDWQTTEIGGKRVANDHSDAEYDDKVIGRLGDVHERFEPLLAEMAMNLPRLTYYQSKLEAALDKAEDGALEWVSDAKIESYHTVWFEMHEDLLRVLGRERDE